MPIHELAGKPAPRSMLANIPRLVSAYCMHKPDVSDPGQRVAFGNDTDTDRHGIVTRTAGLLNPNHYQAVAIWYLFQNRPGWREDAAVGKTLVSSSMIDRVADYLKKRLCEVPVGFKMLNNYPVSRRLPCQTTFMSWPLKQGAENQPLSWA